jgi:hypothetical protein
MDILFVRLLSLDGDPSEKPATINVGMTWNTQVVLQKPLGKSYDQNYE